MSVELVEVHTAAQRRTFHQFSRDLYASDTEFISHIDQDIEAVFSKHKNSEFDTGDAIRWIAIRNSTVVGRIAAFYTKKNTAAGIGFFDAVDDQSVANALFDTATSWLRLKGCPKVEAPVNFGERDKYWGLLVEGFQQPSYQENYNFPYYQSLFENYGFKKTIEQTTSEAKPEDIDYEKYKRFTDRLQERSNLRAEHFKLSEMNRFVKDFTLIYNKAWSTHEHFTPMTEARVAALFNEMKPIIREDLLWFMYDGDEPVGFYLSLIDLNQLFKHVNGNMNWWGKLKFYYHLKTIKVSKVRGIIFGVVPKYQNKGIYSIMVMKMYEVMQKDPYLKSTELAWIGDFNPKMHALFDSLKAKRVKVHYTFQKLL